MFSARVQCIMGAECGRDLPCEPVQCILGRKTAERQKLSFLQRRVVQPLNFTQLWWNELNLPLSGGTRGERVEPPHARLIAYVCSRPVSTIRAAFDRAEVKEKLLQMLR